MKSFIACTLAALGLVGTFCVTSVNDVPISEYDVGSCGNSNRPNSKRLLSIILLISVPPNPVYKLQGYKRLRQ